MKKFILFALLFITAMPVLAQDEYEENGHKLPPYNFIGLQGGVQNTFNNEFNNWKTFTPTASISFGRYFNPIVGARLHFNGIWDKSGVNYPLLDKDGHYNYNYVTGSADVLVNLCTLFGKKQWYPVNVIFIGGLGANYAFENYYRSEEKAAGSTMMHADNDSRWAFNGRVGLGLDIPLARWVSFNIEADLNSRFMGNNVFNDDMLQLTAQAGFNFKFGYKKAHKEEPAPVLTSSNYDDKQSTSAVATAPTYRTRIDTIWYDDVTYKDVTADREIKREIFFDVRDSNISDTDAQIAAVAEFLKGVKDAEITIVAYADRETGNSKVNMNYSKQRAQKTRQALINKGVSPAVIKSVEWKGDTVQPYTENDKNRVAVIKGHGVYTDKEKVVNKKFRTKEVKERVN